MLLISPATPAHACMQEEEEDIKLSKLNSAVYGDAGQL